MRLFVVLALLTGCSACSDEHPGAADASSSAARDAARDTASEDVDTEAIPIDGGSTWFPEGDWDQPFLSKGCSAKVARDPSAAITPWSYQACSGGPPGCEEAIQDWQTGTSTFHPLSTSWYPVRSINGKPIFWYRRYYPRDLPTNVWAIVDVVQELDGPRLAAVGDSFFGNPNPCTAQLPTTDAGIGWWLSRGGEGGIVGYLGGFSSWNKSSSPQEMRPYSPTDLGGSGASVNEWSASGGSFVLGVVTPANVVTLTPADGGGVQFPATQTFVEAMHDVPDGVIGVSSSPYGVRLVGRDASTTMLHVPVSDYVTTAVSFDASLNRVVWLEAVAGKNGWGDGKVFTAPYQTTTLSPTLLTKVPSDYDYFRGFVVNDGYVLLSRQNAAARVVRMSDGMGWDINAAQGRATVAPLWVDDDHVWFFVGDSKLSNPQATAIWRQSRSSWGPPTIPPSL